MIDKLMVVFLGVIFSSVVSSCQTRTAENARIPEIVPAANNREMVLEALKEYDRIGLVVNKSSYSRDLHLVDFMVWIDKSPKVIFAPEHGFRGDADAGELIDNQVDDKTGISIISLYGSLKKPDAKVLKDLDVLVFDLQDVGVRFYTYISTLTHVMKACVEQGIPLIILDRPNPNAHYVDGPVLERGFESFVGLHPIPVVYGMTIGEYALMVNGEGWLRTEKSLDLRVLPCQNYTHNSRYELKERPSLNLPNELSILLYPSLCFFEGTIISVGRGTEKQFQHYGHPDLQGICPYYFTPEPNYGSSKPKHKGERCFGVDLSELSISEFREHRKLELKYLIEMYKALEGRGDFFNRNLFFDKLAGTDRLRNQLIQGKSEGEIRESWSVGLEQFNKIRKKYLIYE